MEKAKFLSKTKLSQLPQTPGVYLFKKGNSLIYIGKARNIRERVKNHPLADVEKVGYIKTDSEIEALILEAKLIKKYQPKNNIAWKDDKNYFFVAATQENFPQIFITHQPQNDRGRTSVIGPFVDGKALKETLKVLRKAFPYRTCGKLPKKPCLWYQLRRCPAPCLFQSKLGRQIDKGFASIKKECRNNVKNLLQIIRGRKNRVLQNLKKEMTQAAALHKYEKAAKIRNQIQSFEKIVSHARIFESAENCSPRSWLCQRAEAYDVANIQGKEATGAMVVFRDGQPDKSQYRQFKIKGGQKPDDIAMLKEVLTRRFNHPEWLYPDLILIDGGKAQLNVAVNCKLKIKNCKLIKVMALAKKNNELYMEGRKKPILLKTLPRETFNLILRLRDEAHRFARRYHHKLRLKELAG